MKYLLLAILSASYGFACRQLEVPLSNAVGVMAFIMLVCIIFWLTPSKRKPLIAKHRRYNLPRTTTKLTW